MQLCFVFPGTTGGQWEGNYCVCFINGKQEFGMTNRDMSVGLDKTRWESMREKGNIPADMVDEQGWLEEREGRLCLFKTKFN